MKRAAMSFVSAGEYEPASKLQKSEATMTASTDSSEKEKTPGISAAKKALERSTKSADQLNADLLEFYRDIQRIANGETPKQASITDENTDLVDIAKAGLLPGSKKNTVAKTGEELLQEKQEKAVKVQSRNEEIIKERTFSEQPVKKKRKSRFAPTAGDEVSEAQAVGMTSSNRSNRANDDIDVAAMTDAHRRRLMEMSATASKAQEVTDRNEGKRHLLQYLPEDELRRWNSDVAKYKTTGQIHLDPNAAQKTIYNTTEETNLDESVGHKMLYKAAGAGGSTSVGAAEPIMASRNATMIGGANAKKNVENDSDGLFQAYRQRMMMAYKHRPNPLNNPRRTYDGYDTGFQGLQ